MTYEQTLRYLYERLPMFSRIGDAAIKKDLHNIRLLCEAMGMPQNKLTCIHIAGTNGKGSVSHMLAAVLQTAGFKTGLYTSPHLHDFRERIKVNGKMMEEAFVISFVEKWQPLIEKLEPSFFEITVAMAFEYFVQEKVELAVIETGLGGRLDSTNIIHPLLSVITNIGFDHMNLLGNTLPEIAGEKAGIIKASVPVVIGESQTETDPVFLQKAKHENASIFFADSEWTLNDWHSTTQRLEVSVTRRNNNERLNYALDLTGQYQTRNLLTVLESVHQLRQLGWQLPEEAVRKGLSHAKKLTGLHGRWETLHEQPRIVVDVAHNEAGIRELLKQVELSDYRELHLVIGMVKDKDISKVLSMLPATASYYFCQSSTPRALDASSLQQMAAKNNLQGKSYATVMEALRDAMHAAHKEDMILVCGSVFTVAEVDKAALMH